MDDVFQTRWSWLLASSFRCSNIGQPNPSWNLQCEMAELTLGIQLHEIFGIVGHLTTDKGLTSRSMNFENVY